MPPINLSKVIKKLNESCEDPDAWIAEMMKVRASLRSIIIDEDELEELGGGVPASSEFADAREEATECGEDPDAWIAEMMKDAEENIRASLRSIIIDEDVQGDSIDALLINYIEL